MKTIPLPYTQESFRKYIGLDYERYDCYEIIKLYNKEVLKRDLGKLYVARPSIRETEKIVHHQRDNFVKVDSPTVGDIILFRVFGVACHIGMYINDKTFFHSRKTTGSCIEKLSVWEKRVVGYYRWPKQN